MAGLRGRRVAITRDEGPDGPLASGIREAGGTPLHRPAIGFRTLLDPAALREALGPLDQSDWLLLTSPRTVHLLAEAGVFSPVQERRPDVAVVGPETLRALEAHGWSARVSPRTAGGGPLLEALLEARTTHRGTVLFPASARARPELPDGLRAAGYTVTHVPLYEPYARPQDPQLWAGDVRDGLSALTFSSPSAVAGLSEGLAGTEVLHDLQRLVVAAQGPTTGRAAREAGWLRVAEAEPHTFPGVVRALEAALAAPPAPASALSTEVNA